MKYIVTYEEKTSSKLEYHELDEGTFVTNYIQMVNDENIYVADVFKQLTYKEILESVTKNNG